MLVVAILVPVELNTQEAMHMVMVHHKVVSAMVETLVNKPMVQPAEAAGMVAVVLQEHQVLQIVPVEAALVIQTDYLVQALHQDKKQDMVKLKYQAQTNSKNSQNEKCFVNFLIVTKK